MGHLKLELSGKQNIVIEAAVQTAEVHDDTGMEQSCLEGKWKAAKPADEP